MPAFTRPLGGMLLTIILVAQAAHAQDKKAMETVSFEREVKPIFRKRCANCHNMERPRGELDLTSFSGVMAGGAGGKAAVPGNPEQSPIYTLAAHIEDPKMPPNAPKIPQREIDTIRRWVEGGMIEKSGDSPANVASGGTSTGESTLVDARIIRQSTAISALAVNPQSTTVAVSGARQILIFDLAARKLLGALPFSEGDIFKLKFSKDGQFLLAAGGLGAEIGKVVLFRTKDWSRVTTLGDEVDAVLTADLSQDGSQVVLGGPTRTVKVVGSRDGKERHTFRKPTDWVTSTSFSPDDLLVAAGDRFGGLFLWETRSGKEFLSLKGHPKAITSMAWSANGDQLITSGEDGTIQIFDLHAGKVIKRWEAHEGGTLSLDLQPSGRIVSGGRDRRVKVWESDGKLQAEIGPTTDQTTRVAWSCDGKSIVTGDLSGEVRVWSFTGSDSARLPMPVASTPATIAFVAPDLSPARRFIPKPASSKSRNGTESLELSDLETALASARTAASAAERTYIELSKLAKSNSTQDPATPNAYALTSANAALTALQSALSTDPKNPDLLKAVESTEQAIKALESKQSRATSMKASNR